MANTKLQTEIAVYLADVVAEGSLQTPVDCQEVAEAIIGMVADFLES